MDLGLFFFYLDFINHKIPSRNTLNYLSNKSKCIQIGHNKFSFKLPQWTTSLLILKIWKPKYHSNFTSHFLEMHSSFISISIPFLIQFCIISHSIFLLSVSFFYFIFFLLHLMTKWLKLKVGWERKNYKRIIIKNLRNVPLQNALSYIRIFSIFKHEFLQFFVRLKFPRF